MKLSVTRADLEDVYRDIVRIPEKYRIGPQRELIPEGSVCNVTAVATGKKGYAIVRGVRDMEDPIVKMDERLRNILGIKLDEQVELVLQQVGLLGQFRWAWHASDPSYRITARMALLSVVLGLVGLLVGIMSIFVAILR